MAGKKQRQRKLAAERYERRLARRAQRDRRARRWTVAVTAVVIVAGLSVGGVLLAGTSSGTSTTPKATPSASASPTPSPTVAEPATHCVYTAAATAARKVSLPPATPDYKATYTATITTNRGAIVIDLLNSKATCTVNSFVHLAEAGFYSKSPCFRLSTADPYMLQCGDPTGKGTGGPGYEFANENLTGATYPAGTLAMANGMPDNPDSNGSQFFLVYKDSPLPADYPPFGKIVSGLNILQAVAKAGFGKPLSSAGGGAPKESVEIESVTIKQT
ncbi:MAG TPA: peptidylprolyl isomerase [Streptosporangiaceae bacterium]|nr:peptidylprolyl isomerase [Streptosporangiaceae bacterium]